jgi:CRP-like cAMP-binding protein
VSHVFEEKTSHPCQHCPAFTQSFISVLTESEITELKEQSPMLKFQRGQTLLSQSEKAQGVYCIKSGIVKLFHQTESAISPTVGFRKAGNMVGHHGIINGKNILSATCLTTSEVCFVPRKAILATAKKNPALLEKLNETLAQEFEEIIQTLSTFYSKTVDQRLVEVLLQLQEKFGTTPDGFIAVPLTRLELSQLIGASMEAVFRALAGFKKKGWLEVKKQKVKIVSTVEFELFRDYAREN